MAECYNCGANVPKGQGYRREVYTGHSSRMYFGRRVSSSRGNSYGVRTICSSCAQGMADRKRKSVAVLGTIFLLLILAGHFNEKTSNRAASSADVTGAASASSVGYETGDSSKSIPTETGSARKTAKRAVSHSRVMTSRNLIPHSGLERRNELWTLASDTDVLNDESITFARVHAGKPVHVIAVSSDGAYLQIAMHDGKRGFIASSAAHFDRDWMSD
jgi:hypothetical protein